MEQIIIPEIQRDYVWSPKNVERLLNTLNDDALSEKHFTHEELESLPPEIRELAERGLNENKKFSNIGFIYAYHDPGYSNKYFLIDGQQRLTTLFLLLLKSSLKNNKQDFQNTYFQNNVPKLSYKVREATQDFLSNFVQHILDGNDLNNIRDLYWYLTDYDNDITIQSIINNYNTICEFLSREPCSLSFDFIENNIEFWYFDTSKSKQGEELYIYMNSRGESVQLNEKIKTTLLENLSDNDKNLWGKQWEEWQDFFWKNRGSQINADAGFNEFLKWIKIINKITHPSSANVSMLKLESFIKELNSLDEITPEFLTLNMIKEFFISLQTLYGKRKNKYIQDKWLFASMDQADYIRLLPVILYIKHNKDVSIDDIERFTRFFYNLPRLENIGKNPVTFLIHSLNLTSKFLSDNYTDVADLVKYSSNPNYQGLLPAEEIFKLNLFKDPPPGTSRKELEEAFYSSEDYSLFNGRIYFIFYCMDLNILEEFDNRKFTFTNFKNFAKYIEEIFLNPVSPSDLFRRALLTKGAFYHWDGNTTKLEGKRYSFINTIDEWRRLIQDNTKMKYIKELLVEYSLMREEENQSNIIFQKIINNFPISPSDPHNWLYYFITIPEIFRYCKRKKICLVDDSIEGVYLLSETKATEGSYIKLSEFIHN